VTGGAGYIGSVVVRRLNESGHDTVVLDDLRTGHRAALRREQDLVQADVGDRRRVAELIAARRIEGALHFAASCLVGESVADPGRYYDNNLAASLALLETLRLGGVRTFVFSSTAAVYGEPETLPIPEEHATRPTNPYGETKLALERALRWYHQAYGLASVSLRYFNAAGATADGALGEDHRPETHLLPSALRAALRREPVPVFGSDYPTPDGTAVRDFVHVEDLAEAHVLALERAAAGGGAEAYNLGNGAGFSVLQVIEAARRITGRPVAIRRAGRRPGDPAILVASSERARRDLGWRPHLAALGEIVETAWKFLVDHPDGYPA
jgi:UDP-glucose 4-epimerase